MAFSKQQLEALKNSLLASGQPILASQHRAQVQGIIDELFDAQSRGNILVAVQSDSVTNVGDTALVFRSGQAYKIPISAIGGAKNLSDLGDLIIADASNDDVLRYNAANDKWENVALNLDQFVTIGTDQTITGRKTFNSTIVAGDAVQLVEVGSSKTTFIQNISSDSLITGGLNAFGFNNANHIYFSGSNKGGGVFAFNNIVIRTYTLQDASGTLALTSDLNAYLPLTGGTLTGQLNGTSAVFSGTLQVSNIQTSSGILTLNPTGGVNLATVSGNVGIGTTLPGAKLEVRQTGDAFIKIRGNFANNSGIIFSDIDLNFDSCAIRNDRQNNALWFSTGGINSERLRITSAGNVEITSTTGALLLSRLTTAQRDALTAVNGMLIYNTSINKIQARANAVWVDLH